MRGRRAPVLAVASVLVAPTLNGAQPVASTPSVQVFTLDGAIQYAAEHYPLVRAALEQVNASEAGVSVARAAYLPRLDSLWQSSRATVNNVFGQVLPQPVLPAISGPVLPSASSQSVWGSAAGALFSWQPFDFGLRKAAVEGAEAFVRRARASEALTRLDVQGAAGAAFLSVLAAERAVLAARADLDRRDVLARTAQTLVDNQLRPGAEGSRADAERAAARTRFILAEQNVMLARTALARVLGTATGSVTIDAAHLLDSLPPEEVPAPAPTEHPFVAARRAAVDAAHAQRDVLARTDLPRVFVQSSVFARGSGANPDGRLDGSLDGLGLDRANWSAGVQVFFPNLFDFPSLRAREAAAAASERAESALYDEAVLTIARQKEGAAAMVSATRAVAANTPIQLAAAELSEAQARARYQAGLANVVEVADAQSLLAQAEFLDQLARVEVWRALLGAAVASGDLAPFLALLPSSSGASGAK